LNVGGHHKKRRQARLARWSKFRGRRSDRPDTQQFEN
jgi:hypothetical protein